jgi:hypothetical protein
MKYDARGKCFVNVYVGTIASVTMKRKGSSSSKCSKTRKTIIMKESCAVREHLSSQ